MMEEIDEPLDLSWFNLEATSAQMFLFARWMAIQYDGNMNKQPGIWWLEQLKHFDNIVLPNYKKNGSFKDTINYIKKNK